MGRLIRRALALILALFMRPHAATGPAAAVVPPDAERGAVATVAAPGMPEDESWYVPRAEDFRPSYDRDIANGGKQTWPQYWGWVASFYQGNLFTRGWNSRAGWLVEGVRSEVEQKRLRARINAIGREICAEWSKDYDVRKVGSADLLTWGKMLEKARADDDGTGAAIHRSIDAVRAAHGRKLGSGTPSPR